MPSSTILLVERDPTTGDVIQTALAGAGYSVDRLDDADQALAQAIDHSLVIVDVTEPARNAADVCREIRQSADLSAIPVLCICQTDEVEERIKFLEAGADDVMAKPFDARELEARVEALLLRFQRSHDHTPMASPNGTTLERRRRLVVVFSPKGGVGTTTIAVNIAVARATEQPDRVLIVDLDVQFGQVATHLDVIPKQTLADLARDGQAMREAELVRGYSARHASGLHVLAAPASPELAESIEPGHIGQILATVIDAYDEIVVDAGSMLDERSLAALEAADRVILPVYPEIAALKAVHTLLDYLNESGSIATKTTIVLNNLFGKEILKMRDVEQGLGAKVTAELPYDPFLYLRAVNEGSPVVIGSPRSTIAANLTSLAATAFGDATVVSGAPVEDRRPRRLAGLLKRT